jgi:hypothetical protein
MSGKKTNGYDIISVKPVLMVLKVMGLISFLLVLLQSQLLFYA